MDKTISIVIAVYNGVATLQVALDSLDGRDNSVELVVIDGGSTDGTVDLICRNAGRIDHWISEEDSGIYNAWNKGLAAARGEWICFVGADDWYEPGGIDACLQAARAADADVEYISSRVCYHALGGPVQTVGQAWRWPDFQRHMTVAHVGSLHRRSLYGRLGTYDESYRICGDYELLLRARETLRASFIPIVTAHMGGAGFSNNQLRRVYQEKRRAQQESGGRSGILCAVESRWDHMRARAKRALWAATHGGGA